MKPRVLVIEREIEIQKRIAHCLEGAFRTDLTSSGSLALLLMKDYRYACILASYQLPNRHRGSGMLRALRDMPGGRFVPVIATGTEEISASRDAILAEGFADVLELPRDLPVLDVLINEALEGWD